jgi:PhoPQ-activated pathogenicity-related protein
MRFALPALVLAFTLPALADPPPTALKDYVVKEDKSFSWKLKEKTEANGSAVYTLTLTSQTWHGVEWTHDLQVFIPKGAKVQGTMVLWNQGGSSSPTGSVLGLAIAEKVGAPVAFLFGVPKQPLYVDPKTKALTATPTNPKDDKEGRLVEDALIAETFVRYLDTKDESWPLLFPMVKSVVRAMDALQVFMKDELKGDVKQFVVTGASKRGWTSWLTAASGDKRVKAIAPLVIDTLNFPVQMQNQLKAFGKPSEMIADYTRNKLVPIPDTTEGKKLWQMVDPYIYKDAITVPKMLIHGTNDPYWPQDALNTYWDELKGDKYVCCVPNAGHDLREVDAKEKKEALPMRAVNTLSAFAKSQIFDTPMPKLTWEWKEDNLVVSATGVGKVAAVRVWVAKSDSRDFRKSRWEVKSEGVPGDTGGAHTHTDRALRPEKGFTARFVEYEFKTDAGSVNLSTQIQILEAKK